MKKIIKIKTNQNNYSIEIGDNSIIPYIKKKKKIKKIFIIIDQKVCHILKPIENDININIIRIKASEKIKSIDSYWKIILMLLKLKIDRSSVLIAIGGGTIGDLSGFIASTILRGIKFVLVPSTLLSQVDSSIGGKNGINCIYGKNLVGTFLQPNHVIIETKILKSLPIREIRSGYAEIIKQALIHDFKFYKWLEQNYESILKLKNKFLIQTIIKSIKIKSTYIANDEKENLINSKSRAMLNFGHTYGHALEALEKYKNKLNHGEAVAIGMATAALISHRIGSLSKAEYLNIVEHLRKAKLPTHDKRINSKKIYDMIELDKKNTKGSINLILLKKIGQAYYKRNLNRKILTNILNKKI